MTEKNPPEIDASNEAMEVTNEGILENTIEHGVELSKEGIKEQEDLEKHIEYLKSDTHRQIREAQAKKPTGAEEFEGSAFKKVTASQWKPWYKKAALATAFTLASIFSFGNKGKAGSSPEDSLAKKQTLDNIATPKDSIESKDILDPKKYEKFGITRIDELKTSDSTKHLMLVVIPDYKNYGEIFDKINKSGFKPASTTEMDKALETNQEIFKKYGSVIALDQVVNKLGKPSYNTMNWDKKANTFRGESREIDVGIDSGLEWYGVLVEAPRSTNADYQSGLAKK